MGPGIVRQCAARHPEVRLNFVEGVSAFIFKRLIDQELTLCLMHNPPRHQGIDIEPLYAEPMVLVGPGRVTDGHPPVKDGMPLDRLPLILPNRTHGLRMALERAMAEQGGKFEVAVQVDGYTTTKAFVAAGLGYTVLPLSSVRREVEQKQLSAVRLRKPKLSWTLSLAYRKDQRNARAVMALRDIVAAQVKALAADERPNGRGASKRTELLMS